MLRRLAAEGLGTFLLTAITLGSGAAAPLAGLAGPLGLLPASMATGAGLYVLITVMAPVSGGHINPVVSLMAWSDGAVSTPAAAAYVLMQLIGAVLGIWAVHVMFGLAVVQIGTAARWGVGLWFSEAVATFGMMIVIIGGLAARPAAVPGLVGLYIMAGFWFTSSTAFANPALLLARALTTTAGGIAPLDAIPYALAEFSGAAVAIALGGWLFTPRATGAAQAGASQ